VAGSNVTDPSSPDQTINARNLPMTFGGKRKTNKRKVSYRRRRNPNRQKSCRSGMTQRGGSYLSDFFLGSNNGNVVSSFGNTPGVFDTNNILGLNQSVDPRPYIQPISQMYGAHNSPLV
jgi:hypothetical protein